jgi:hypothetical protein
MRGASVEAASAASDAGQNRQLTHFHCARRRGVGSAESWSAAKTASRHVSIARGGATDQFGSASFRGAA